MQRGKNPSAANWTFFIGEKGGFWVFKKGIPGGPCGNKYKSLRSVSHTGVGRSVLVFNVWRVWLQSCVLVTVINNDMLSEQRLVLLCVWQVCNFMPGWPLLIRIDENCWASGVAYNHDITTVQSHLSVMYACIRIQMFGEDCMFPEDCL